MDSDRWQLVKRVLQEALEKEPADRDVWLEQVCGEDTELRQDVESLLRASSQSGAEFDWDRLEHGTTVPIRQSLSGRVSYIGEVFGGRYVIEDELGYGGFGSAYRAKDQRMARTVVVKIPHQELLTRPEFRKRFAHEIRQLVELEHLHIVPVLDGGKFESVPYAVLRYLGGGSLSDRLQAAGNILDPVAIGRWLPDIADAVDFVHRRGFLHRDIKPGNILFDEEGHVFLGDFGIAKAVGDTSYTALSNTGFTPGTPAYQAPETGQAELGPAYDQYALAVVVYRAVSDQFPHELTEDPIELYVRKRIEAPRPLGPLAPALPEQSALSVMKALSTRPEDRYSSCRDFVDSFKDGLRRSASIAGKTTVPLPRSEDQGRDLPSQPDADSSSGAAPKNIRAAMPRAPISIGIALLVVSVLTGWALFGGWIDPFRGARLENSRSLAAQAIAQLDSNLDLGLLLSVLAIDAADTVEAKSSLLAGLQTSPGLARILHSPDNPITSVAISPDGAMVAAGSQHGTISLWDSSTWEEIGEPLTGHGGAVICVAFSPDGRTLASGSVDTNIRLWRIDSVTGGTPTRVLTEHRLSVSSVSFSPDGRTLASGSEDTTVRLWDLEGGGLYQLTGLDQRVHTVTFLDGQRLASGSSEGVISLWDVQTGERLGDPLSAHDGPVLSVAVNAARGVVASGSADGSIRIWNAEALEPLGLLEGHRGDVTSLTFSRDGMTLASGSKDSTIRVWRLDGEEATSRVLTGHGGWVNDLELSADAMVLVSGSEDQTIGIWEVAIDEHLGLPLGTPRQRHQAAVIALAYSPNEQLIASGSEDGTIILWDPESGPRGPPLVGHRGWVQALAISPDGGTLASGGIDETVMLWDVNTGRPIGDEPLAVLAEDVKSLAFSPDNETLAIGTLDEIVFLNAHQRTVRGEAIRAHNGWVDSLTFRSDGEFLASGGKDRTIALWDLNSVTPLRAGLNQSDAAVATVSFSPDGQTVAWVGEDNDVHLWDLTNREETMVLTGHESWVYSVAFSPDGLTLASAGEDGSILLWDVATRSPIGRPLRGHESVVYALAFSPDGQTLVSGGGDANVRLWDLRVERWRERACRIANRNLTPAEWDRFVGEDREYEATCRVQDAFE